MEKTIMEAMHNSMMLTRDKLWYPETPYIPKVRTEFSMLPRPGFVGSEWNPGGVVLIGSNGNSTEAGDYKKYETSDRMHLSLLMNFKNDMSCESFNKLMEFEKNDIMTW